MLRSDVCDYNDSYIVAKGIITFAGTYVNNLLFNWDSHHARLHSHYKAWNYKMKLFTFKVL